MALKYLASKQRGRIVPVPSSPGTETASAETVVPKQQRPNVTYRIVAETGPFIVLCHCL